MSSTTLPVTIVGAGISGLTLGLCLKHKGIPAVIYDRAASPRNYSYGVVLRSATYRPLLKVLRMDEATFRSRTAVDSLLRATVTGANSSSDSFRCHRGRLEDLLRKDLTVVQEKQLKEVERGSDKSEISALFEDGQKISTRCLIGCDGPHSMTRRSLSSVLKLEVLPYVVFNGKRRISLRAFADTLQPYLGDDASVSTLKGDVRLDITLSDIDESQASIRYTYSRPAKGSDDSLHKADRSPAEATAVSEQFYTEIAELPELEPPFGEIFNVEDIRKDSLLHWLMRIVSPNRAEAGRLADSGVLLIGDAAHALPILGGEGANVAIHDSISLAEHIASKGIESLETFSEQRFESWQQAVEDSKRNIAEMHTASVSHL